MMISSLLGLRQFWLLHIRTMLFRRFRKRGTIADIFGHVLIRLYLRGDQVNRLLGEILRETYNAVDIPNEVVSRVDDGILVLAVESDWRVDLKTKCLDISHVVDDSENTHHTHTNYFLWSSRAYISREDLGEYNLAVS